MGFEELEVELKRLCIVVEEKSELKYLTEILEKNNIEVFKKIDELKEDMRVKQQNQPHEPFPFPLKKELR